MESIHTYANGSYTEDGFSDFSEFNVVVIGRSGRICCNICILLCGWEGNRRSGEK